MDPLAAGRKAWQGTIAVCRREMGHRFHKLSTVCGSEGVRWNQG